MGANRRAGLETAGLSLAAPQEAALTFRVVPLGGYTLYSAKGKDLAGCNLPTRNAILKAMYVAGAEDWGYTQACNGCMHGVVRRDALVAAYEKALAYLEAHPDFMAEDRGKWSDGSSSRDVALEYIRAHLEALQACDTEEVVEDDLMICDHLDLE